MPRDWLKHQYRTVGKRASRGGSSYRQREKEEERPNKSRHNRYHLKTINFKSNEEELSWRNYGNHEDNEDLSFSGKHISSFSKNKDTVARECEICCEIHPLVSLLKKCNHAHVCHECLRKIYVKQAQQDVSNYPLQCYHPSCRKDVCDVQFIKHDFIYSEKFERHYRFMTLGKAYSRARNLVYCPQCELTSTTG